MKIKIKGFVRYFIALFFLCNLAINVNAQQKQPSIGGYVKETKKTQTYKNEGALECNSEYGPAEIFYGDVLYIDWTISNVSEKIAALFGAFRIYDPKMKITVSCKELSIKAVDYLPELNDTLKVPKDLSAWLLNKDLGKESRPLDLPAEITEKPNCFLRPDQSYKPRPLAIEFPPLEDWNEPFWQELREKMRPEGIVCDVSIYFYRHDFKFSVLVKPHSSSALLENWFESTSDEFYPKKSMFYRRKITWETFLDDRSLELCPVMIKNNPYPPYLFMRYGYRKPGVPNLPKTLDEWKQLEKSLSPCALRDEVTFAIKQIEYYSAENDEVQKEKLNSLVAWVKALPAPQRSVYIDMILERFERKFPAAINIQEDLRELAVKLAPDDVANIEDPERLNNERTKTRKDYERQEASERNARRVVELRNAIYTIDVSLKENLWLTEEQKKALNETRSVFMKELDGIIRIDPSASDGKLSPMNSKFYM